MSARIGLDLDGVVYDWDSAARFLIAHHWGIDLDRPTSWDYIEERVPAPVWEWLWTEAPALGMFRYGHLWKGAIEGVRMLAQVGDVEVVTHRPKAAVNDTLRFLSYNDLPLSGVHILSHREPKSSVGCDVYIDDGPHVAEELTAAGKAFVLVDRPWNRDVVLPENAVREGEWGRIPAAVRRLLP